VPSLVAYLTVTGPAEGLLRRTLTWAVPRSRIVIAGSTVATACSVNSPFTATS
jgi:hypothetical protein